MKSQNEINNAIANEMVNKLPPLKYLQEKVDLDKDYNKKNNFDIIHFIMVFFESDENTNPLLHKNEIQYDTYLSEYYSLIKAFIRDINKLEYNLPKNISDVELACILKIRDIRNSELPIKERLNIFLKLLETEHRRICEKEKSIDNENHTIFKESLILDIQRNSYYNKPKNRIDWVNNITTYIQNINDGEYVDVEEFKLQIHILTQNGTNGNELNAKIKKPTLTKIKQQNKKIKDEIEFYEKLPNFDIPNTKSPTKSEWINFWTKYITYIEINIDNDTFKLLESHLTNGQLTYEEFDRLSFADYGFDKITHKITDLEDLNYKIVQYTKLFDFFIHLEWSRNTTVIQTPLIALGEALKNILNEKVTNTNNLEKHIHVKNLKVFLEQILVILEIAMCDTVLYQYFLKKYSYKNVNCEMMHHCFKIDFSVNKTLMTKEENEKIIEDPTNYIDSNDPPINVPIDKTDDKNVVLFTSDGNNFKTIWYNRLNIWGAEQDGYKPWFKNGERSRRGIPNYGNLKYYVKSISRLFIIYYNKNESNALEQFFKNHYGVIQMYNYAMNSSRIPVYIPADKQHTEVLRKSYYTTNCYYNYNDTFALLQSDSEDTKDFVWKIKDIENKTKSSRNTRLSTLVNSDIVTLNNDDDKYYRQKIISKLFTTFVFYTKDKISLHNDSKHTVFITNESSIKVEKTEEIEPTKVYTLPKVDDSNYTIQKYKYEIKYNDHSQYGYINILPKPVTYTNAVKFIDDMKQIEDEPMTFNGGNLKKIKLSASEKIKRDFKIFILKLNNEFKEKKESCKCNMKDKTKLKDKLLLLKDAFNLKKENYQKKMEIKINKLC